MQPQHGHDWLPDAGLRSTAALYVVWLSSMELLLCASSQQDVSR
jgi:hypothetical protein